MLATVPFSSRLYSISLIIMSRSMPTRPSTSRTTMLGSHSAPLDCRHPCTLYCRVNALPMRLPRSQLARASASVGVIWPLSWISSTRLRVARGSVTDARTSEAFSPNSSSVPERWPVTRYSENTPEKSRAAEPVRMFCPSSRRSTARPALPGRMITNRPRASSVESSRESVNRRSIDSNTVSPGSML
ncbi:hypothetical protein D3C80_1317160 [compost metagenome]